MSLVSSIARYGLDEAGIGAAPAEAWPGVLAAVVEQRITGHAMAAADAGALVLNPEQFEELLDRHEEQLALDLRIERMLLCCDEQFGREGISFRLLKGPAVARRFYDDPALRSFGDGDVLVRGDDMDPAIEVLAGVGFERRFSAPRPVFDRRFVKAVSLVAPDGLELDLHRALTPGPFGVLFDVEEIFDARPDTVALAARLVPCLSAELALAHACAHAVLGDPEPRFVSVRDVAEILRSGVDPERAIAMFERFQAEIVGQRAIRLVEALLEVRPAGAFAEWSRALIPSRLDLWRLRSYVGASNRYARQAAATLWVLPSMRERVAYASALAFPARGYLDERHDSYARRFARSTRFALRGRPR